MQTFFFLVSLVMSDFSLSLIESRLANKNVLIYAFNIFLKNKEIRFVKKNYKILLMPRSIALKMCVK
jgi:hypothetical protein